MTTTHRHKAIPARQTDRGWTHCVTPAECAADPARQDAHGNIVRYDTCSCGAVRLTEINGKRSNYGSWDRPPRTVDRSTDFRPDGRQED